MKIEFENIVLRDYQLSDIEDEIRWTNVDTAWFYADTPWAVMEKVDPDELRADMIEIMESMPIPLFSNVIGEGGDDDVKAVLRDYARRIKTK